MYFKCFQCGKEFENAKYCILHLKLTHFIKNNTVPMQCLVVGNVCSEKFYCFNKLKSHMKECRPNVSSNINERIPELSQTNLEKTFESLDVSDCVRKQQSYELFYL